MAFLPLSAQVEEPADSLWEESDSLSLDFPADSLWGEDTAMVAVSRGLKGGGGKGALPKGGGGEDSIVVGRDSIVAHIKDSLKANSDIKEPIKYSATDSIELIMDSTLLILHNTAALSYQEMTLEAHTITVDWGDNLMAAKGRQDSLGKYVSRPVMTDDGQKYLADSMKYNLKSQRGIVKGALTQDGDNIITGKTIKKSDDGAFYIQEGRFTTCDAEHPHFYIRSPKLKIIPKKQIISGPLNFVIEDLPIPIVLPFGVFPNQTGRRSGIVFPTYGESPERGFFLRDGGYYFAISEKMDLLLKGDIYTNASFRLDASTSYKKRYRLDGTFGLEYGRQRYLQDDGEMKIDNNFAVRWTHNQNIDPTSTFKASVNAATSGFFQRNSYNEQAYLQNTLKSSITYSKSFANSPFRLTASLDHSQNLQTKIVDLGLPNIQFAKARTFPFKPKRGVSRGRFYEKIGYSYTLDLTNRISVPDSLLTGVLFNPTGSVTYIPSETDSVPVTKQSSTYFKNGIRHSIPITTQFNALKYINFTPNFTYNEFWYIKSQEKTYYAAQDSVGIREVGGFDAARSFQASLAASTRIYGVFQFKKSERKTAIRHTMSPSLSYTYKPDFSTDFWGYFKEVPLNMAGDTVERYNPFVIGAYGGPGAGEQQSVTFSLQNLLELKTLRKQKPADSTATAEASAAGRPKLGVGADSTASDGKKKEDFLRVNLIDNLGVSATYNFAAESRHLSDINLDARTNLFQGKLQVQTRASLDPYRLGADLQHYFYWTGDHARLPRMANFNVALSTTIGSKRGDSNRNSPRATPEEIQDIQYFRDMYVDFNIPWKSNIGVVMNYTHNERGDKDTTLSLNVAGDFNLTPRWKIGYTSGYDFTQQDFSYTSFSIYRDLHCWEMSATWIPFGDRKSYFVTLNVKSATLKDLKLTKRNDWQDRF